MCCQLVLTRLWKQLKTVLSSVCLRFKSVWFVFSQAKINHTWTVSFMFSTRYLDVLQTQNVFILLSPTKFTQVSETSCQQHFKYPTLHTFCISFISRTSSPRLFTCTLVCIFVRSLSSHLLCFLLPFPLIFLPSASGSSSSAPLPHKYLQYRWILYVFIYFRLQVCLENICYQAHFNWAARETHQWQKLSATLSSDSLLNISLSSFTQIRKNIFNLSDFTHRSIWTVCSLVWKQPRVMLKCWLSVSVLGRGKGNGAIKMFTDREIDRSVWDSSWWG